MTKTRPWDAAEYLDSEDAIAAYFSAALLDGDPSLISAALGDIARARGMAQIARDTGLSRESLYRALSPGGNPTLDTVVRVSKALGLTLSASVSHETPRP